MVKQEQAPFEKYLFVCERMREDGRDCCAPEGIALKEKLKQLVEQKNLKKRIRVCSSGCLDRCAFGPTVLLEPDHLWFSQVTLDDADAILELCLQSLQGV